MSRNVLETPLGLLFIEVDGHPTDYSIVQLNKCDKRFCVDGRYRVTLFLPTRQTDVTIKCGIKYNESLSIRKCAESGENLSLVSFYYDGLKLSIGTEDDIKYKKCDLTDYGLTITLKKNFALNSLIFGVSWVTIRNPDTDDIYTWFAADPTIDDLILS